MERVINMTEHVTDLRQRLDGLANYMLEKAMSSKEEDAARDVIWAKAWLGKVLAELGQPSPYKNDGNRKEVKDIEPTADTGEQVISEEHGKMNHIEFIDWQRQEIAKRIKDVEMIFLTKGRKGDIAKEQAYINLCNARFELGFLLERIRKNGQEA